MWNDVETTQDFLNFSMVAETVAALIVESNGEPIFIIEMVLNRIVRNGKASQWEVNLLYAALHITEAFPSMGGKLVGALSEIPSKSRKVSYIPVLKNKDWAADMLQQWAEDNETPTPVVNSINGKSGRKK